MGSEVKADSELGALDGTIRCQEEITNSHVVLAATVIARICVVGLILILGQSKRRLRFRRHAGPDPCRRTKRVASPGRGRAAGGLRAGSNRCPASARQGSGCKGVGGRRRKKLPGSNAAVLGRVLGAASSALLGQT
jgi:hypothetical protein